MDKPDKLRVLALSSTAAGGVLILFLLDYFHFALIDGSFSFTLMVLGGSKDFEKAHMASKIIWCLLTLAWALTALQAWRHRGGGGTAAVGLCILVVGIGLTVLAQVLVRKGWFLEPL